MMMLGKYMLIAAMAAVLMLGCSDSRNHDSKTEENSSISSSDLSENNTSTSDQSSSEQSAGDVNGSSENHSLNDSNDSFPDGNSTNALDAPSLKVLSPENNLSIPYSNITLEVGGNHVSRMTAENRAFSIDLNQTRVVNGVKNGNKFYFYNMPLLLGNNEIKIIAIGENGLSVSGSISILSDANGSAPIGMRAGSFEGVGSFQTTVEVGTLLNASEYLFDIEGDGVIDDTHTMADGNFSVNLNKEGRYKPRVTVRTTQGTLYSSGDFALSLDVKADAKQVDPKGAEAIDVAKRYVKAIINNDRETVERLLGHNERMIRYVYGNPKALQFLAETYGKIISWQQTYHDSGCASVKIQMDINGTAYDGGFEMNVADMQVNTGRFWYIRFFY